MWPILGHTGWRHRCESMARLVLTGVPGGTELHHPTHELDACRVAAGGQGEDPATHNLGLSGECIRIEAAASPSTTAHSLQLDAWSWPSTYMYYACVPRWTACKVCTAADRERRRGPQAGSSACLQSVVACKAGLGVATVA